MSNPNDNQSNPYGVQNSGNSPYGVPPANQSPASPPVPPTGNSPYENSPYANNSPYQDSPYAGGSPYQDQNQQASQSQMMNYENLPDFLGTNAEGKKKAGLAILLALVGIIGLFPFIFGPWAIYQSKQADRIGGNGKPAFYMGIAAMVFFVLRLFIH